MSAGDKSGAGVDFERFRLDGRVAVITGGAGLLGGEHAAAIQEAGGIPVLWDVDAATGRRRADELTEQWGRACAFVEVDIRSDAAVREATARLLDEQGRVDILINNAANDPKVGDDIAPNWSRLENFPMSVWESDVAVGLTGAFLCARALGGWMATNGGGVVLNVVSDLGLIAPDQRIYRDPELSAGEQPVKPVTYSVIKHGLIGLTRYLATYWAEQGVRVNALCPGGVRTDQPQDFVERLTSLIPLGRMAEQDEYRGAIQFVCSDAASYMTGACLSIDGGRTTW